MISPVWKNLPPPIILQSYISQKGRLSIANQNVNTHTHTYTETQRTLYSYIV